MPSISLSLPNGPTLPPGATPAIGPAAPALGDPGFAAMISAIGGDATSAAPTIKPSFAVPLPAAQVEPDGFVTPPMPPVAGSDLPPERPDLAGSPDPLPPVAVEDVMIGSTPPAPVPDDETTETAQADAAPAPTPGLVACGLQDWRLGSASRLTLARALAKPLPVTPPLPPQQVEEDAPAEVVALPADKAETPKAEPAQPVAAAPQAPPPFAPIVWAPPPVPAPAPKAEADSDNAPAGAQPAPAPIASQPAQPQAPIVQAAAQPVAQQQTAMPPHGFTLPPEIARDIAQFVHAATADSDERAPEPGAALDPLSLPPLPQSIAQPSSSLHTSFVPAHRPVIDTGRAEWMQNMIERIAEMPSVDNKREAQIRLVPDALGPVDVKIEQRDQRLHVTMNAQTPEARQLLSDAAPKLQELAEARGIRFAQAAFGGADAQDRRQQADQQQSATPLRPRPVSAETEPESETDGDLIA
ncbi:flagellar hook-length control protein FliK [Sphingomonas tabacisoli]|uniref:Flagellar hook-length control protein FliK n=1 Tax=Sphingomonas tabacisoli TaxID=2249466 RepID=A0ABW4I8A5_9SPHN